MLEQTLLKVDDPKSAMTHETKLSILGRVQAFLLKWEHKLFDAMHL
jgi:hypothetical protein